MQLLCFISFERIEAIKCIKYQSCFLHFMCLFYLYSVCINSFNYFFTLSNRDLVLSSSKALTKASLKETKLVYESV